MIVAPPFRPRGFSIVEMLVVVALLLILIGLAAPAVSSLMRANGVASAGDQVLGVLSQARLAALSRNRSVEVRFFRYTDPARGDAAGLPRYHALQSFVLEPAGSGFQTNPLGRQVKFPIGTTLSESEQLSPALAGSSASVSTGSQLGAAIPVAGLNYTAAVLRFRADGSLATQATNDLFLTVIPALPATNAADPGQNFATISIQPATGKARLLRP